MPALMIRGFQQTECFSVFLGFFAILSFDNCGLKCINMSMKIQFTFLFFDLHSFLFPVFLPFLFPSNIVKTIIVKVIPMAYAFLSFMKGFVNFSNIIGPSFCVCVVYTKGAIGEEVPSSLPPSLPLFSTADLQEGITCCLFVCFFPPQDKPWLLLLVDIVINAFQQFVTLFLSINPRIYYRHF